MSNTLTTILLVDDDPDDQYIFNNALKVVDKSIFLSIAKDGVNALEKLRLFKPDLIFLDMNMPRMNGMEFLSRIRMLSTYHEIPIVVYSTYTSAEDKSKAASMGVKDCIEKPVFFEDTVNTLRKVICSYSPQGYA
ncbi:MAG: response regulator receiver protein [Bacteroidota bacterium]|jgi:CheY-like chemotaxis protein|nr:response regulator receiver protein [Bacteroidota bacterium]